MGDCGGMVYMSIPSFPVLVFPVTVTSRLGSDGNASVMMAIETSITVAMMAIINICFIYLYYP